MQKCAHPLPKQTVVKILLLRNTWHGKESRNLCSFLVQCRLPRRTGDAVYFIKNLAHPQTSSVRGQCLLQVVTQVGLLRGVYFLHSTNFHGNFMPWAVLGAYRVAKKTDGPCPYSVYWKGNKGPGR